MGFLLTKSAILNSTQYSTFIVRIMATILSLQDLLSSNDKLGRGLRGKNSYLCTLQANQHP